ncbi:hypothetical protein [Nubsella zeaxanthinifaciens]|uniref:hypothetical protein n=1 Tax=Nubsella zeaxanthinifaciens TaxID=392412 RepID=UPI000DE53835|nr:hypothetical protein [Nubsella zeaxanthinifaciens]
MAKKVSTKFGELLSKMKRKPKDNKGRFKDRDFAKQVSRELAEIRRSGKQKKLNFKRKSK